MGTVDVTIDMLKDIASKKAPIIGDHMKSEDEPYIEVPFDEIKVDTDEEERKG